MPLHGERCQGAVQLLPAWDVCRSCGGQGEELTKHVHVSRGHQERHQQARRRGAAPVAGMHAGMHARCNTSLRSHSMPRPANVCMASCSALLVVLSNLWQTARQLHICASGTSQIADSPEALQGSLQSHSLHHFATSHKYLIIKGYKALRARQQLHRLQVLAA